ncbi:sugar phosphate isomerase/epimerase [Puniceicoccaceae bacterium K14]|nr:sugar phosphate isomerase/epimerase [Puniceicoccaceae bacterium K14]
MILSGFTDEAGAGLSTQIKATKELGWSHLSARTINGVSIHDLPEDEFGAIANQLDEAEISVVEIGSLIGSWSKEIESDFDITLGEIERVIPRMKRLGTKMIRIMSYAQKPWGEDQKESIRFERLREIVKRLSDHGLEAIHENCMNWGGFSAKHTLRLLEEVPGLKLVFDTGNPVFQRDRSLAPDHPWQNPLEFLNTIIDHVIHVHVKDCLNPLPGETEPERYTFPGEGQAKLVEILQLLDNKNYKGGYAIEPHVSTVFHAAEKNTNSHENYSSYVRYGKQFQQILDTSTCRD